MNVTREATLPQVCSLCCRLHTGASLHGVESLCVFSSMSHQTFTPHGRSQSVSKTCADLHYVSSRFATPFAVASLL